MSNFFSDAVLDATLNQIATATTVHLTDGAPATFADVATQSRGSATLTSSDFSAIDDAPVGGRRLTVTFPTITTNSSGNVDHGVLTTSSAIVARFQFTQRTVSNGAQILLDPNTLINKDPAVVV